MTPQQALGGGSRSRPFPKPCARFAQRRRQLLLTAGVGGGRAVSGETGPGRSPPRVPSTPTPTPPAFRLRSSGRASAARPRRHPLPLPPPSVGPGALQRRGGGREPVCAGAGCGAFLALSGAQPPEAAGAGRPLLWHARSAAGRG